MCLVSPEAVSVCPLLFVLELLKSVDLETSLLICRISKLVPYLITSVGHGTDPAFLVVSLQVTLVINPVVGCCYFPPGLQLLSQPNWSHPWSVPNYIPKLKNSTMSEIPSQLSQLLRGQTMKFQRSLLMVHFNITHNIIFSSNKQHLLDRLQYLWLNRVLLLWDHKPCHLYFRLTEPS